MLAYPHNESLTVTNSSVLSPGPDLSPEGLRWALSDWRPDLWEVTKVTVLAFTLLMALIGNAFIIAVSRRIFQQSAVLRTLLISVSVANIIIALTIPLHIAVLIIPRMLSIGSLCLTLHASVAFYVTLILVHFVLFAMDRLVALRHPLRFRHFFKPWYAAVLLLIGWLYAGVSTGALLMWQVERVPGNQQKCHPEEYLKRPYRLLHLVEYGLAALITLVILIGVYVHSCEKRRTARISAYARRRRRAALFSLRRNKLLTETLITAATLFLAMGGPYFASHLLHLVTSRTSFTAALDNIAVLIILLHAAVSSLVFPWKVRSFRYQCLYCACPCLDSHKDGGVESSEDEADTDRTIRHISIHNFDVGESNTDSLYKSLRHGNDEDTLEKSGMGNGVSSIPDITITDYDTQKRITLRSDGKVSQNNEHKRKPKRKKGSLPDPVWTTLGSGNTRLYGEGINDDDITSTANLYFLNPVDNDFLDIPREDEV